NAKIDPPPRAGATADPDRVTPTLVVILLLVLIAAVLAASHWRERRRHREFVRLLDGADALETVLHEARRRMSAMRVVVGRVAPDIGAEAQASLEADAQVQQALRNVLEHRLWIARHAEVATYRQLHEAVQALQRSRQQIASRLEQLESAG